MIRAWFLSSSRSASSSGKKTTPKGQSSHRKERKDDRAAAGDVATTASGDASPPESHRVICKAGNYVCPLCGLGFKLNQTYGNHVKAKECKVSNPSLQHSMSNNNNKQSPFLMKIGP
jgi:hypothetical protein